MNVAGRKTDLFEGRTYGIHHGWWAADKNGCVTLASRKEFLQYRGIEAAGSSLEIPLPGQDMVYGEFRQLGFECLELVATQNVGLSPVAPNEGNLPGFTPVGHVAEHHPLEPEYALDS